VPPTAQAAAWEEEEVAAGGVDFVEYRQNRAVVFVSDRFHRSEAFDFPDGRSAPRVNLAMLFGDRADLR